MLLGDAGHFKDPAAGQGIGDAFRQGEALVEPIVRGLEGSDQALDQELVQWGRWRRRGRDRALLAGDRHRQRRQSRPPRCPRCGKRLLAQGELAPLINLFSHRGKPSQVLTPPRLAAAMGRVFARPGCDRRALLREIGGLVALNARRQRQYRWPVYEQAGAASDARATEVLDSTHGAAVTPTAREVDVSSPND